jgi:microcystin-dependent protein
MRHKSILAALLIAFTEVIHAQVPQIINYQGRITSNGSPFTGNGQFKFALVSSDGTTSYWSNNGTSANGDEPAAAVTLPVAAGLYVAPLGDTAIGGMQAVPPSVFGNTHVFLRVWFNDGTNGSQLLAPDQRVASVGYAMMAAGVQNGAITTAMIAPGAVTAEKLAADSSIPAGTVVAFAGTTAPTGWALCNGQTLDGTQPQFAALFSAIGQTYGGTGNNFLLPDLRGRVVIGAGQGSGLTNRLVAQTLGTETHTLTIAQMPSHNHAGTTDAAGAHNHTFPMLQDGNDGDWGGPENGTGTTLRNGQTSSSGNHSHSFTTNASGGNQPHNIIQPSLVLNYIIKL